jgi:hypothetical protein
MSTKPPIVFFTKVYEGFEDVYDLGRDIHEAFDTRFNSQAACIPAEFQGRVVVSMTYIPEEDDANSNELPGTAGSGV